MHPARLIRLSAVFLLSFLPFASAQNAALDAFDRVGAFFKGVAPAEKDGRHGFIDESGREVIPVIYERPIYFFTDAMVATLDGKVGLINKRHEILLPFAFDEVDARNVNSIRVQAGGLWGLYQSDGTEVLPVHYEAIKPGAFTGDHPDHAVVAKDFYWGVVDRSGRFVVPPAYEEIEAFDANGLARVKQNSRWGMVDREGAERVPAIYESIGPWTGKFDADHPLDTIRTFYPVSLGTEKTGALDTQLNKVIPETYFSIEPLDERYLLVSRLNYPLEELGPTPRQDEMSFGVFSFASGTVFLSPEFKYNSFTVDGGFLWVRAPGLAVYNEAGKQVIPPRKYSGVELVGGRFFEARVTPSGGWAELSMNSALSEKEETVVLNAQGAVIFSSKSGVADAEAYAAYLELKQDLP
ncbi:WG repeat-containing protein [Actomonas aquatica]|uniref:WG repeat-containing protein n=1 Tax=Actomonas aquatica TaxID=2866162 RepID=A0ABZ1C4N0_9BACT|nr:WG repeat-containing protein [Opitutus sp. WL0086]WRQ86416.1 WG repeat-containing protein [Opitutus sp. WL0086]